MVPHTHTHTRAHTHALARAHEILPLMINEPPNNSIAKPWIPTYQTLVKKKTYPAFHHSEARPLSCIFWKETAVEPCKRYPCMWVSGRWHTIRHPLCITRTTSTENSKLTTATSNRIRSRIPSKSNSALIRLLADESVRISNV